MNVRSVMHRQLVDLDVLRARVKLVTAVVDALQHDPTWKHAGDIGRRKAAKRIAFCLWRFSNDGSALRNRRENRT